MKTILLYNPISGHGHLDSWHALFVRLLLERGYRVLAATPDEEALRSRLGAFVNHANLRILEWEYLADSRWESWWRLWYCLEDRYTNNRPDAYPLSDASLLIRVKKWLLRSFFGSLKRYSDKKIFRSIRISPQEYSNYLVYQLKKANETPAFVFNMYLDMYDMSKAAWKHMKKVEIPWGGARFVPCTELPLEPFCHMKYFSGLCLLEGQAIPFYRRHLSNKIVALLPDITDVRLPSETSLLEQRIRQQAKSRCVVFFGGSITPRKNLNLLMTAIEQLPKEKWFFVVVGHIHREHFRQEELARFDKLCADTKNLFIHEGYLKDEADFNAAIVASDIIFALYKNFPGSSNLLSKAAYFEKPILVSRRYLMGERVRHYGFGLTVEEDDEDAALIALETMRINPIPSELFAAYRAEFNDTSMGTALEQFIEYSINKYIDKHK